MEFGNLMSYGPDLDELFRHSTKFVDKIVRGTNPSDLPVEFPTRYPLISIIRPYRTCPAKLTMSVDRSKADLALGRIGAFTFAPLVSPSVMRG
jgi:hypothetical protein